MADLSKRVIEAEKTPVSVATNLRSFAKPRKVNGPDLKDGSLTFRFDIQSDIDDAHMVAEQILGQLEESGIVQASSSNVYVALVEAISNAIRHGNKGDRAKRVEILLELNGQCARITVRDQGKGFDPNKVPDPCAPENLLVPGGRGVLLIRYIMDEVRFNKRGNEIIMTKYADRIREAAHSGRRPRQASHRK